MTTDGAEAWQALQAEDAPRLAILDWMMPGDGRRGRVPPGPRPRDAAAAVHHPAHRSRRQRECGDRPRGRRRRLRRQTLRPRRAARAPGSRPSSGGAQRRAARGPARARDPRPHRRPHRRAEPRRDRRRARAGSRAGGAGRKHRSASGCSTSTTSSSSTTPTATLPATRCSARSCSASSASCGPTTRFGRFGGEEFLVLVPGSDEIELRDVLERIRGVVGGDADQSWTGTGSP